MSRIGKHPVEIPSGVTVTLDNGVLTGKGKNGVFEFKVHESVISEIIDGKVVFKPRDDSKQSRAMWGTCRAIVSKGISGLAKLFTKKVTLVGVGYKASVRGNDLVMQLGYSHDIILAIPDNLKIVCESPTVIAVSGADRQRIGEIIRRIQKFRAPEPYKGTGILMEGQHVYRKEGKKK
jgi:large subunit ribosomal protein L6